MANPPRFGQSQPTYKLLLKHPIAVFFTILVHLVFGGIMLLGYVDDAKNMVPTPIAELLNDYLPTHTPPAAPTQNPNKEQEPIIQASAVSEALINQQIEVLQARKEKEKNLRDQQLKDIKKATQKLDQEKILLEKKRITEEQKIKKVQKQLNEAETKIKSAQQRESKAREAELKAQKTVDLAEQKIKTAKQKLEQAKNSLSLSEQKKKEVEAEQARVLKEAQTEAENLKAIRQQKQALVKEAEAERLKAQALSVQRAQEALRLKNLRQSQLAKIRQSYINNIQQTVRSNWRQPPNIDASWQCQVNVLQSPNGEILDVKTTNCTGDKLFETSVQRAVYRSEPLPQPVDKRIFDSKISFRFTP